MNRNENVFKLQTETFDLCIIGGGASGAGAALDASIRGLKVALIELDDFASATSSKSTKLIHGGVRYLELAFKKLDFNQLKQVKHGLAERQTVIRNAPHLATPLALLTPVNNWLEGCYYALGLKLYDWFAGKNNFPKSKWLKNTTVFNIIPTLSENLHSAIQYYDGYIDDARYCLAIIQTAQESGAVVANHIKFKSFTHNAYGKIDYLLANDVITGSEIKIKAKCYLNCAGPYADNIRLQANKDIEPRIRPSKGVHLILNKEVLNSDTALLIPKTADGRIVFAMPFEGKTMIGTTDNDYTRPDQEPVLEKEEVSYLLDTLNPYLEKKVTAKDVLSGFGGIRPLITANTKNNKSTKQLLRDHEVEYDDNSGLVSLLGGKWTTYRIMAKDAVDKICELLGNKTACTTKYKYLVGGENYNYEDWQQINSEFDISKESSQHLIKKYGTRAMLVASLCKEDHNWKEKLHPLYPYIKAEVVYAVRFEMAQKPRDILARRFRIELLDWQICSAITPIACEIMAAELNWSEEEKRAIIESYQSLLLKFYNTAVGNIN